MILAREAKLGCRTGQESVELEHAPGAAQRANTERKNRLLADFIL